MKFQKVQDKDLKGAVFANNKDFSLAKKKLKCPKHGIVYEEEKGIYHIVEISIPGHEAKLCLVCWAEHLVDVCEKAVEVSHEA